MVLRKYTSLTLKLSFTAFILIACTFSTHQQPEKFHKSQVFFWGDGNCEYSAWNHVTDNQEWDELKNSVDTYQISSIPLDKQSCEGKILKTTLIKKLGDWNQQHPNGIEILSPQQRIRFNNIQSLNLELKINQNLSSIPTFAQLKSVYGSYLAEEVSSIDTGNYVLGITIFNHTDKTGISYNLSNFQQITANQISENGSIKLQIPLNQFYAYREENYEDTTLTIPDFEQITIDGIRIVAESTQGKVLRNYNQSVFLNQEAPIEIYKEIALNILSLSINTQ